MSIADAPVAAAARPRDLYLRVQAFVAAASTSAVDGLTVSEFAELTAALLRLAVAGIDAVPMPGPDRKVWVLDVVAVLFDEVADRMIPTLAYPVWVLLRPSIRSLVLASASGVIEQLLPLVRADK